MPFLNKPKVGQMYQQKGKEKSVVEVLEVTTEKTVTPCRNRSVPTTWIKVIRYCDKKTAIFPLGEFWLFHGMKPMPNQTTARILYSNTGRGNK